jgi:hypothetical protein
MQWFPTERKGFPQSEAVLAGMRSFAYRLDDAKKGLSGDGLFASLHRLCYSNQAVDKQWSLPVARAWPAPTEGSGKLMEWNSFVGSDVMRCCTVNPCR